MRIQLLFRSSYRPFCDMLSEAGIDFVQNPAIFGVEHKSAGSVMAAPFAVEIIGASGGRLQEQHRIVYQGNMEET